MSERLVVVVMRAAGAAVLCSAAVLFSASPAGAASSCGKVKALIKPTLGVAVKTSTVVRNGHVFECIFGQPGTKTVMVNFQSGMSPAKLKVMRSVFGGHSTMTYSGLGLPAFSSVEGAGGGNSTGLVVLKGGTAVEVFWGGPLAKIAALMRKILPTV